MVVEACLVFACGLFGWNMVLVVWVGTRKCLCGGFVLMDFGLKQRGRVYKTDEELLKLVHKHDKKTRIEFSYLDARYLPERSSTIPTSDLHLQRKTASSLPASNLS